MRLLLIAALALTSSYAFAQVSESVAIPFEIVGTKPEVRAEGSGFGYTQTKDQPGFNAGRLYAHVHGSHPNGTVNAQSDAFAENVLYVDGALRLTATKFRGTVTHGGRCRTGITTETDYFYDTVRLTINGNNVAIPTQPAPGTVVNFTGGRVELNLRTAGGDGLDIRETTLIAFRLVYNGKTIEIGDVSLRTDCKGTPVELITFEIE